jgi:hypothetical protein
MIQETRSDKIVDLKTDGRVYMTKNELMDDTVKRKQEPYTTIKV